MLVMQWRILYIMIGHNVPAASPAVLRTFPVAMRPSESILVTDVLSADPCTDHDEAQ